MYTSEILSPSVRAIPAQPLHIAAVGRFRSQGNFRWEQVSGNTALHCIRDGRGVFIDNGEAFPAAAGDVFLFQPGHHYQYHDQADAPWRYDFLTFEGGDSDGLPQLLEMSKPHISLGSTHPFWAHLDDLVVAYHDTSMSLTTACKLTWSILDALAQPATTGEVDVLGVQVRSYLERLETDFPTVDQLAFRFNVSRATLFRAFRAVTGVSVKQWIDGRRFLRAQDLLRVSDAPVFEVSRLCGFQDALYFSRAFKQRFGASPRDWRAKAQEETSQT